MGCLGTSWREAAIVEMVLVDRFCWKGEGQEKERRFMSKSRLTDVFGTTCPIINFILRQESGGYSPTDSEMQEFMRQPMPLNLLGLALDSPLEAGETGADRLTR